MRYLDLLNSSINNALRGMPAEQSPALDAVGIADTLFPIVSQSVSEAAAADPAKRSLLRRTKTITLTNGEATLTPDVLTKFFTDAVLYGSNLSIRYTYRDYPDFQRRGDKRIGIFTRNGATLMVIDPGQSFTQPLIASGQRTLVVPCSVVKPASATDDIDATDEVISDLDEALSEALRGVLTTKAAGASV